MESVCHAYGRRRALDGVSFSLEAGQIGCLMGPSGSGKTTVLLCAAGLESVVGGRVRMRGKVVSESGRTLPPEKRGVGMLFQEFALFPHLTIAQNIAFGLPRRGVDAKRRVAETAEMCGIGGLLASYPHELSGGEQQRAALARALAPKPDLLLLDEPFSKLDGALREKLTRQMREILKPLGITALVVTHNQWEGFAIADVGGVINGGALCQWSAVYDLYHRPQCSFVADFVGDGALLKGRVVDAHRIETALGVMGDERRALGALAAPGDAVQVLLRPDDVAHDESGRRAQVLEKSFRGATIFYRLKLANDETVVADWPGGLNFSIGDNVGVAVKTSHLVFFPAID